MKKIFASALLMSLFLSPHAQQTKLLTAEKHNEYGLVYTLPKTAFEIEVVAVKETRVAGPFYKYAKKVISDSKVISEDGVNWTIEGIKVRPYGVPDTENQYLMQLKPGALTYLGVGEDGMLLTINKEPASSPSSPIFEGGLEGTPSTGKEYLEFMNEDFVSAQSDLRKAELLGEELMEIRDAKISLSRGTAETMPTDGRQLELMLASLEKQEKALTQAFTGNSWKEKFVSTFSFLPEEEGRSVIFRLSDFNGLVDADDYSGEPVYVSVKIVVEPEIPVDNKGEEKKLPKDAVMYCLPATVNLSLSHGNKTLFSKDFQMSQFGTTFGLNPTLFTDKKEPSFAIFNPATGALMELGQIKNAQ